MQTKLLFSLTDLCVAREFFHTHSSSSFNSTYLANALAVEFLVRNSLLEVKDFPKDRVSIISTGTRALPFKYLTDEIKRNYANRPESARILLNEFAKNNFELHEELLGFCNSLVTYRDLSEYLSAETQEEVRDQFNVWEGVPLTYENIFMLNTEYCGKYGDEVAPNEDGNCSLCNSKMNDQGECLYGVQNNAA